MSPLADVENDLLLQTLALLHNIRRLIALAHKSQCHIVAGFLTGANPFVLKAERLLEIAGMIARTFPEIGSIGWFARVTAVALTLLYLYSNTV